MGQIVTSKKFALSGLVGVVLLLLFTRPGMSAYAALAAPYPVTWLTLRPGMTTGEIRQIAGPPTADGRGLKGMDVWEINRLGVRLRLEIFHGGDTDGCAVVQRVTRSKQWIFPGAPRFDEYLFGNAVQ